MDSDNIPANAPIRQIKDWPTFFEQVRRRPGMWVGSTSLTALQHLLNGISLAEFLYEVPPEKRLGGFQFDRFESWADRQFNPRRLSINSFVMACRLTSDEEQAFHLWFQWYDQFNQEQTDV